jgi:hypothetical protein
VPIILAILLIFLNKHSLGTSACPIYPMQKKNPGHLYLTHYLCLSVENPIFFKHQVDQKYFLYIHEVKDTWIRDLKKLVRWGFFLE